MIEIEIKARLKDKENVKQQLEKLGCIWSASCQQVDTIYIKNTMQQIIGESIFRLRKCNKENVLTLKILEEDLDTAIELELNVSDAQIMDKILNVIGFLPKVQVIKNRQTTEYKGFQICIDEVEKLGDFIEIEKLSESSACKEKIYIQIMEILSELGINENDIKKEKYFEMFLKNKK